MCLYQKLIRNRKYTANKKNGGVIPPIPDIRVLQVPVGCGKCIECRKQKAREWKLRLLEDIKYHPDCKYVTLTFNNESLNKLEIEVGEEVIKHLEKIRKNATNLTTKLS